MDIRSLAWVGLLGGVAIACGSSGSAPTSDVTGGDTESADVSGAGAPRRPRSASSGAASDGGAARAREQDAGSAPPAPNASNPPNPSGSHARSANNQDCCFDGTYYACPDTTACFGGFDVNACTAACEGDVDCIVACTHELETAPPPLASCKQSTPPAGVRCN